MESSELGLHLAVKRLKTDGFLLGRVEFFLGGLLGAKFATKLSNVVLERVFGVALLLISLKMIFAK